MRIKVSGNPLKRKATLWRKPSMDSEGREDNDQRHDLTCVVTLENEGVKKQVTKKKEKEKERTVQNNPNFVF